MIKEFSERFKKLYDTFLWPAGGPTRKAVKIKQNALTWPKEKGGMNLVSVLTKTPLLNAHISGPFVCLFTQEPAL